MTAIRRDANIIYLLLKSVLTASYFLKNIATKKNGAAALAASSLVPASTKVTVDGKAAAVEGYNIDNGNNYYKLRDFASALDVGLTWDKATDTAAIDAGSHYKPDATQLITGNWAPLPAPASRP